MGCVAPRPRRARARRRAAHYQGSGCGRPRRRRTARAPGGDARREVRAVRVPQSLEALDVADAFDRLAAIAAAEKERRAREGAKNDLEAAIYRVRNALDDRAKEIQSLIHISEPTRPERICKGGMSMKKK